MANLFDTKELSNFTETKNLLFEILSDKENSIFKIVSNEQFDWIKVLLEDSLDEIVKEKLNSSPPVSSSYYLLDISDHFTTASEIIGKSLSLRKEIFDIQTNAITTGLEILQILFTLDSEKKLSNLNLEATFKQSQIDNANLIDYKKALDDKFNIIAASIKTKLLFLNQEGNPLNYGERFSNLTTIYCSNIKSIYERLFAIKRTLFYSFGQNTLPIPNTIDVCNNLDLLVEWFRRSVNMFEKKSQTELIFQKCFSLNNPFIPWDITKPPINYNLDTHLSNSKDIDIFISPKIVELKNNGSIEFNITPPDILINRNLYAEKIDDDIQIRLLGIDIGVIELSNTITPNTPSATLSEMRNYHIELEIPMQDIGLELPLYDITIAEKEKMKKDFDEAIKNKKPLPIFKKIDFGEVIGIDNQGNLIFKKETVIKEIINFPRRHVIGTLTPSVKSNYFSKINFKSSNSLNNINPLGNWKIFVKNVSPNNILRAYGLSRIEDIVLSFKLAIIKKDTFL